ncbi:uncharacterized protein TNIN_479011 [Trichonephila inaurata madagascariensis]|uniref:Uncharacterized protein n=1 Tax=Trichonephila inaurata madagascariensis TaxID=2747483 RepID=A0A8X6X6S9_9ARAC|nr:uncharacterized protein TNIN_479011 [Trichonephila inaurata madagascariensis]
MIPPELIKFQRDKRLRRILVTSNPAEIPKESRNSYQLESRSPVLLCKSMRWIGLLTDSNQNFVHKVSTIAFQILLILINLSLWISFINQPDFQDWKTMSAYLTSFLLVSGVYFAMHCRRKALMATLQKLNKILGSSNEKTANVITILIFCLPAVYSILTTLVFEKDSWLSRFETYGYVIESHSAMLLLISIKSFFYALVHPAFTCLVSLLHCVLCQSCCSLIINLTQKIMQVSPEDFGPSRQMDILRGKAKIDDALHDIQYIFSVSSFFLTGVNFLMCGSMIGWILHVGHSMLPPYAIVEIVFYFVTDFSSLISVLWMAGNVPIELKKLKHEFYKKVRLRLLHDEYRDENQLKGELFGESEFSFSGCDIISLKRKHDSGLIGDFDNIHFSGDQHEKLR